MSDIKTPVGALKSTKEKVTKHSVTVNDITRSVRVREVENGFIVEINEEGYKGTGDKRNWYHANQTFISKTNPIKDTKAPEKSMASFMKDAVENLTL